MDNDYVLVAELAIEFEIPRSNTRKWLIANGFGPCIIKVRPGGHGQQMLALRAADAERARALRRAQGYIVRPPSALEHRQAG